MFLKSDLDDLLGATILALWIDLLSLKRLEESLQPSRHCSLLTSRDEVGWNMPPTLGYRQLWLPPRSRQLWQPAANSLMSLRGCRTEAEHCFDQEPGVSLQHKNDFQSSKHCQLPPPPPIFSGVRLCFSSLSLWILHFWGALLSWPHALWPNFSFSSAVCPLCPSWSKSLILGADWFFLMMEKMKLSKKCLASCLCECISWAYRQVWSEPHFEVHTHGVLFTFTLAN